MKSIFTIGHHDIKVFLKDKSAFVWLFVIPFAFVYFTGFTVRPPDDPKDVKPGVYVENLDDGFMGNLFLEVLGNEGVWIANDDNKEWAKKTLKIPAEFTEKVINHEAVEMQFLDMEDAETGMTDLKSVLVEANMMRAIVAFNGMLLEHATESGMREPTEAKLRKLMGGEDPVVLESKFAGRKPMPVGFNNSLPGIMVMYLLMNLLIFGGSSIANDRISGVLKRLSIQPITPFQLIFGKLYGLMLLAAVQIAGFLVAGHFIFKVDLLSNLPSILLTVFVFSWVAASLGMLLGFLVKNHDKVVGMGIMLTLPMAALGGCWWPLEITPDTFQLVAHIVPTAWAMDSLHQSISFGGGLDTIVVPLSVLIGYGIVANVLAAKFYRV